MRTDRLVMFCKTVFRGLSMSVLMGLSMSVLMDLLSNG
jgi:hypothetical protein